MDTHEPIPVAENITGSEALFSTTTEANVVEGKITAGAVITVTICIMGLIGNLVSLTVLFNRRMRCFGHVYLLLGLTVCDIIVLVIGLIRTTEHMELHSTSKTPGMKTIITIVSWIGSAGTKYFTVAVSIERFLVVYFPLKATAWTTVSRERIATLIIFAFMIFLSALSYLIRETSEKKHYDIYSAVVMNFIPFAIVIGFNIATLNRIAQYTKQRNALKGVHEKTGKAKHPSANNHSNSVTRMLLVVVLTFVFCYSFEAVRRVASYIWPEYYNGPWLSYRINILSDIFYVLNSSVNFIIYCLLGNTFRTTFITIMREYFPCCCNTQETGDSGAGKSSTQTTSNQI